MQGVTDRLDGAATILLKAPLTDRDADDVCKKLLCEGAADGRQVLWVSFTSSPPGCVHAVSDDDVDRAVLAVGEAPTLNDDVGIDGVTVETVSTPTDLAALGIKLSQFLSTASGDVAVCFDSVTALLQHVDLETAYEFLHTITLQFYTEGARVHFHLDPAEHDEATVATITSLCDAVVSFDETPTVRGRPID